MFIIADEDITKIKITINDVLYGLTSGHKRVDQVVELGNGLDTIVISGYWINDIIRIDTRIKK